MSSVNTILDRELWAPHGRRGGAGNVFQADNLRALNAEMAAEGELTPDKLQNLVTA